MPVSDPAFGQIVGRQFHGDTITGENTDSVAAKFACEMSQDGSFLVQLNTEQTTGKLFNDGTCDFNAIFFTHCRPVLIATRYYYIGIPCTVTAYRAWTCLPADSAGLVQGGAAMSA